MIRDRHSKHRGNNCDEIATLLLLSHSSIDVIGHPPRPQILGNNAR